ncbi:MAG TPA: hypothetical protein VK886_09765 [Vicinamibacterales bacterium]|nr:hypothetical protein [Vicinamibacterales bacterium]
MPSRRAFLAGCLATLCASHPAARALQQRGRDRERRQEPRPDRPLADIAATLRGLYPDLPSHFVFEYYPWYSTDPWRHWNEWGAQPPATLATNYLPLLGPYDSRSARVIEQHAKWIAESGAGAINLSWWGPGSHEDRAAGLVMDVMRAFGIQVTFHLEPYHPNRALRLVDDVMYLLREYGDRRHWDNFLLLRHGDGSSGPVFKGFSTLLPPTVTDCLGVTRRVEFHVPPAVWREQIARLRRELRADFDRVTILGDVLDVGLIKDSGFDGGTSSDPYLHPDRWTEAAGWFDAEQLLCAFGVNPGFHAPEPTPPPDDPCYRPRRYDPPADIDWASDASRSRAHQLSAMRIQQSFDLTVRLQTHARSANHRRGFFLVYVNSFNEWPEGTQFEPMKDYRDLTAAERRAYHNAASGTYRLDTLRQMLERVI